MRVTLLLAQCSSELLKESVRIVTNVLQELEVEIHQVELHKLPYFEGKITPQMESIMASIKGSQGVIAISSVPMLGMHGAMQSFFDSATLYDMAYFNKPLFVLTYSNWLGEQEAGQLMQKCWNILGGTEGGNIYMNESLSHQPMLQRLEKEIENFYRLVRQERPNIGSSERLFYYNIKHGGASFNGHAEYKTRETVERLPKEEKKPEIRSFAEMIREENHHINISTKEQTIKEIASLIEKEANGEEVTTEQIGIYTRPPQIYTGVTKANKRLQQIPPHFAAQYDKSIHMVLKYHLVDVDEKGYIIIRNGDCSFEEETEETPTVEMILAEEVLKEILDKKITYQKAFMLGKLKVKGNFSVLPKLDQIFKAL